MRTLGIDLAGRRDGAWYCLVSWCDNQARVLDIHEGSIFGAEHEINAADCTGINAPFGWPIHLAEDIATWSSGATLPDRRPEAIDTARITEQQFPHGATRLNSRAAHQPHRTWSCCRMLSTLPAADRQGFDRVRGTAGVIEVNSRATMDALNDPQSIRGTGKDHRAAQRCLQVQALEQHAPWLDIGTLRDRILGSEYAIRSLVAALTARAFKVGETDEIPVDVDQQRVALEGWCHRLRNGALPRMGLLPRDK